MPGAKEESVFTHLINGEPFEKYKKRSKEYVTSHQLSEFRRCPKKFRDALLGIAPESEDTSAYLVGRAAHTAILEGLDEYRKRYEWESWPINEKTGEPYGDGTKVVSGWKAQLSENEKEGISKEQNDLVMSMYNSVMAHQESTEILTHGFPEQVGRTTLNEIPVQCRIDWFSITKGIVDLKTCNDLTWFEQDAKRFEYAYQFAFYRSILRELCEIDFPVSVIAVEKKYPFRVGVWQISAQTLEYHEKQNNAALERLRFCMKTNTWPTGYEAVRVFDHI